MVPGRDVIATMLAGPLDWTRFESLAHAVLVADDLPRLRKLGGGHDKGADAVEEGFYDGGRRIETIVQISSERAQRTKISRTIAKLREHGTKFRQLVFVTRHPVTTEIRNEAIEGAEEEDVALDIRADDYLIAQLSKPGSPLFARFFGNARDELAVLLGKKDPLHTTSSRVHHGLLAALGAYVLSPQARLVRGTLFENTVLGAIAAAGGPTTSSDLLVAVEALLPGEQVEATRLAAAIQNLARKGLCTQGRDGLTCTQDVTERFFVAGQALENAFRQLLESVLAHCRRARRLDDAQLAYLDRNVRHALLTLVRCMGPVSEEAGLATGGPESDVGAILARDLPVEIGRAALAALSSYVQDKSNAPSLAPVVRTYATLAIRNLDPFGRRWQQSVLARSTLALDTDALLHVLVHDLPEHRPLLTALRALQEAGVRLVVSPRVLEETIGHVSRADRTFRRFADELLRLPSASVDANVWHAVVRGYYYAVQGGFTGSPEAYWSQFYDPARPAEFVRHVLGTRLTLHEEELADIPEDWSGDAHELGIAALNRKEQVRWKAAFREEADMETRARADVLMILHLAARTGSALSGHERGYLISEDGMFSLIERHPSWRDRGTVHVRTRALPQLASLITGDPVDDYDLVRLLFDPVIAAAADQMKDEISLLTRIGVDLRSVPLTRLEWDLSNQLKASLRDLGRVARGTGDDEASRTAVLNAAKAAKGGGYALAYTIDRLTTSFESTVAEAAAEAQKRREADERLSAVVGALREGTSRTRRRVNHVLRELGIEIPTPEGEPR